MLLVLTVAALLLGKTISFPQNGVISVTVMPQNGPITTIDTPKNNTESKSFEVNSINFENGTVLEHKKLGILGYTSNFFMKLETRLQVKKAGHYTFYIASDDGFRLWIDDKQICEHPTDRPFQTSTCSAELAEGKHLARLEYFQGGGPMGLKALYKYGENEALLIGTDSRYMTFEAVK